MNSRNFKKFHMLREDIAEAVDILYLEGYTGIGRFYLIVALGHVESFIIDGGWGHQLTFPSFNAADDPPEGDNGGPVQAKDAAVSAEITRLRAMVQSNPSYRQRVADLLHITLADVDDLITGKVQPSIWALGRLGPALGMCE